MLAKDLIDRIERLGLLDPEVIGTLRQHMQETRARLTPEALAKFLVDNGQLTRFQATKLIGELRAGEYNEEEVVAVAEEVDDLAMLGDDEGVEVVEVVDENSTEAVLLDDDGGVLDAQVVDEEVVEAEAVEVYEAEAVDNAGRPAKKGTRGPGTNNQSSSRPQRRPIAKKAPQKSQWDSFKIYGYATILTLTCVLFGVLYWWFTRGSEEEYLKNAEGLYNSQNFAGASAAYTDYLKFFSNGRETSLAKVRIVISRLFLEKANHVSNTAKPYLLAKELLPTIENEPYLNDERGNVAGFLMDVADAIARQADSEVDTKRKGEFLNVLKEHQQLMENPNYIPTSIKQNLQPRFDALAEVRAKVARDIDRVDSLAQALIDIRAALEKKDTAEAYRVRRELVRAFPQLAREEQDLADLVLQASQIQQELVKTGQDAPEISNDKIESNVSRSIDLANRKGEPVADLTGQVYYARTRGSIVALGADDGRVLWRQFVGFRDQHAPVALGTTPEEGVLLSDGERLEIQKLNGNTGEVDWRAKIGETFSQPVVFSGVIYLSTTSGRVMSLDAETGIARWVSLIPQPVACTPGVDSAKGVVYVVGDHSNLYVLSAANGKCLESFYVGHEVGTITTAPTSLLGHMFLVENAAKDFSLVHCYRVDEKGLGIKPAQGDFRLVGNVKSQPEVTGRRLNVLTDRGQVAVLDVEVTAEKEQVSMAAELPYSYEEPVSATIGVERGQMWVAGSRLVRYELQINTGKVVRDWVIYDGDMFNVAPRPMGAALIVSRVVSGTQGLRISALNPKTGQELWRTDIGVPTSLVATGKDGTSLYAVSGQAALFALDGNALKTGSTVSPVENPGISGRAMRFGDPIDVDQGRFVLHNSETPGQLLVFDPTRDREKLRLVATILSGGKPTVPPTRVDEGILFCLDSGRLTYMNWQTGAQLSSPFQAPAKPGEDYTWTNPVVVGNGKQFVVCDGYKQLRRMSVEGPMKAVQEVKLERTVLGGAAAIGDSVLLAASGPGSDLLVIVDATSLESKSEVSVSGKILAGPFSVKGWDDSALVMLDGQRLRAIDGEGKQRWELELPEQTLAGSPLYLSKEQLLISGTRGWVWSVNPETGAVVGKAELSQPISTTPMRFGAGLLVPGAEGAVFAVPLPQGNN